MSGPLVLGGAVTETSGGGGVDEADGDGNGDGGETATGPGSGAAGDEGAVTGATEDAVAAGVFTSGSLACWIGGVVLVVPVEGLPTICCNCLKASLRLSPSSDLTFNRSIACLGFKPYFSLIMRMNCCSFTPALASPGRPDVLGKVAPMCGRVGGTTTSLLSPEGSAT